MGRFLRLTSYARTSIQLRGRPQKQLIIQTPVCFAIYNCCARNSLSYEALFVRLSLILALYKLEQLSIASIREYTTFLFVYITPRGRYKTTRLTLLRI